MKEEVMTKENERGETTEYVYNLLKERIFGWSLSPGQKINISLLAREFNVSAIPLREALSRLHSQKLVHFEANKGYWVSDILDKQQMKEMFEARALMETYAIRQIIRANRLEIIHELSEITEKMYSVDTRHSYKEVLDFVHLDQKFHSILMKAGGNTFLSEAYEGMYCHLHIARFYYVRGEVDQRDAAAEHREIIDAIRTRDIYRAEEAVASHIHDVSKRLLEKWTKET
ncbi:GntR family transcriptional regulator [Ammoniphilus resinae]|nr:GntR family transcriptional regulator [Ammoniphilus resinae]